jgi:hypothetical protein
VGAQGHLECLHQPAIGIHHDRDHFNPHPLIPFQNNIYSQVFIGLSLTQGPREKKKTKLRSLSQRVNYTDRVSLHLSAKFMPTFADRGCHVVSMTDPYGCNLGFLDRSRNFFFQVAPQLYSQGWVNPVISNHEYMKMKEGIRNKLNTTLLAYTQALQSVRTRGTSMSVTYPKTFIATFT